MSFSFMVLFVSRDWPFAKFVPIAKPSDLG